MSNQNDKSLSHKNTQVWTIAVAKADEFTIESHLSGFKVLKKEQNTNNLSQKLSLMTLDTEGASVQK